MLQHGLQRYFQDYLTKRKEIKRIITKRKRAKEEKSKSGKEEKRDYLFEVFHPTVVPVETGTQHGKGLPKSVRQGSIAALL
jgi:hypothetical protein